MDSATKTALLESIDHWNQNVAVDGLSDVNISAGSCALCRLFNTGEMQMLGKSCRGCPVYQKTGKTHCKGSPYVNVIEAREMWMDNPDVKYRKADFRKAARAELKLLKGLLK